MGAGNRKIHSGSVTIWNRQTAGAFVCIVLNKDVWLEKLLQRDVTECNMLTTFFQVFSIIFPAKLVFHHSN